MDVRRTASLALMLILAASASAQLTRDQLPPDMASRISDEQLELVNWMMFYYLKPAPDLLPNWLQRASAEGILREEKSQFPFLGFESTLFAMNANQIPG
jgi:hypothetical protein